MVYENRTNSLQLFYVIGISIMRDKINKSKFNNQL